MVELAHLDQGKPARWAEDAIASRYQALVFKSASGPEDRISGERHPQRLREMLRQRMERMKALAKMRGSHLTNADEDWLDETWDAVDPEPDGPEV